MGVRRDKIQIDWRMTAQLWSFRGPGTGNARRVSTYFPGVGTHMPSVANPSPPALPHLPSLPPFTFIALFALLLMYQTLRCCIQSMRHASRALLLAYIALARGAILYVMIRVGGAMVLVRWGDTGVNTRWWWWTGCVVVVCGVM